jgi:hypothetical protein
MLASFTMEPNSKLTAIQVFSCGELDSFDVDRGINHFLSGFLQVVPEGFSGNAHHICGPVLLNTKEIAKADSLKLFYAQVNNFKVTKRNLHGLVIIGSLWEARYPVVNSVASN